MSRDITVGDLGGAVFDGHHPDDRPRTLTSSFAGFAAFQALDVRSDMIFEQLVDRRWRPVSPAPRYPRLTWVGGQT